MASLELQFHPELTKKQKDILRAKSNFLILKGPFGTSKSYIALARGLKLLKDNEVDRVIIVRSAVEIRGLGYLPGDRAEKIEAYSDPYIHLINELSPKKNFKALQNSKDIEFISTSFLRGVTWDDAFVLVDEYQNMNEHELETVVTRVGVNTHLVLCGDTAQSDLRNGEAREHLRVIETLESMKDFTSFEFTAEDIVRSDFVRRYYEAKMKRQSK